MSSSRDGDPSTRAFGVVHQFGPAEVDHPVVVGTQQHQIRQVCGAAVAPIDDVVGVAAVGLAGAAPMDAAAIADAQCGPLGGGGESREHPDRQRLPSDPTAVGDHELDAALSRGQGEVGQPDRHPAVVPPGATAVEPFGIGHDRDR